MHSACRPVAVVANTLAGHLIRVSVRLVPGNETEPSLPFDEHVVEGMRERVPGLRAYPDWVVLRPSDPRRARVMILGLDEHRAPTVFIKATLDEPNRLALQLLEELEKSKSRFVFPRVTDMFRLDQWWITVEEPLPQLPHKPARLDPPRLYGLTTTIQSLMPPRDGLVCSHGDFGPWNVRRFAGGLIGIIDWEYANWSPMAVDALWYAVTLPLATTREAGERAGERALDMLSQLYPDQEIGRAAEFIIARRKDPEPLEIRERVERTRSLIEFESKLEAALSVLTD